ncbi:MAG: T9SS type A sorting domain-containing protein [Bacteroidetes bacterium]|nr:T9SS type A sorting domain-containing protein [Bacteroidota bacterium]
MKKSLLFVFFAINMAVFAQWSNHSFTHGGITRDYRIHVPAIYNGTNSVPLVIALHGLGDDMTNFSGIGLSTVADTANFISVYPQAISDPLFGTAWNSGAGAFGQYPNQTVNDVDFIKSLIDTISAHYNINSHRVYATGFSMGGFMTNRLACELSTKIASFASVSGTIGSGITCTPSRAISICHFHGTGDATVSYTNNTFGMNAQPLVNFWVTNNNCNSTPVHTNLPDLVADGYTIEHDLYSGGNNGTVVEHFKVNNGPHTWLFTPANDIDYSTEIWKFFMTKTLPTSSAGLHEYDWNQTISLYPNPAKDVITVTQTDHLDFQKIALFDVSGKCCFQDSFEDTASIDISSLSRGVYILKCYTKEGFVASKKVILQ